MKPYSPSQRLLIEEVMHFAQGLKKAVRGFSIGALIQSIRRQLGMSQRILSKRAGVPQSTISRVEKGHINISLLTLKKILNAISCELVLTPLLQHSIDDIRRMQAKILAKKHVSYLKGTMNLEDQEPDTRFIEELLRQEEERLLNGPSYKLWEGK